MLHHPAWVLLFFTPTVLAQEPASSTRTTLLPTTLTPAAMAEAAIGLRTADDTTGLLGCGPGYTTRFDGLAVRFEPVLGDGVATTQHLELRAPTVRRGAVTLPLANAATPEQRGDRLVVYQRADGCAEHFELRPDGVELSWHFANRPAGSGDLVVRYDVATTLPGPGTAPDGGVAFELPGIGGLTIGGVTGIDRDGRRVAGRLACIDGHLELSLPERFVDAATYPIVLDPLVNPQVATYTGVASFDATFDAASQTYLLVREQIVSAAEHQIIGQRFSPTGQSIGAAILFRTGALALQPRVANLRALGRFAVAWVEQSAAASLVALRTFDQQFGVLNGTVTVASASGATTLHDVDIGGEGAAQPGAKHDTTLVWRDETLNAIRLRRVSWTLAGALDMSATVSVWTDSTLPLSSYDEPAISRSAGDDGQLLLVVSRAVLLTHTIQCRTVDIANSVFGPVVTVSSPNGATPWYADVDGIAGSWVVAFRNGQHAAATVVSRDPGTGTLSTTPPTSLYTNTLSTGANWRPVVAYGPARSYVGYMGDNGKMGLYDIVPPTGQTGNDSPTLYNSGTNVQTLNRVVTVTGCAGGTPESNEGLVFHFTGIAGQMTFSLLRTNSGGGTITNLGGSCAPGGTTTFSGNPAIGSNHFVCSIENLPPTTLLTIFNFAQPGPPLACGTCVATPWLVTLTPPIVAGRADVAFPIPGLSALIGAALETQWTSIDIGVAPCPFLPNLVVSDRSLLILGQ
ncbi:MAG: hypothetical protein H6835_03065 [Planctomycetes bacterium]|nr:hypothetical protein [Planctomycetota bacterium]